MSSDEAIGSDDKPVSVEADKARSLDADVFSKEFSVPSLSTNSSDAWVAEFVGPDSGRKLSADNSSEETILISRVSCVERLGVPVMLEVVSLRCVEVMSGCQVEF